MEVILDMSRNSLYAFDSLDKSIFFKEITKRNYEETSLNNQELLDSFKDKEITLNHFGWFNTNSFLIQYDPPLDLFE